MNGKRVVEIGAGTALGAMASAKMGAASVLITDRPDEDVTTQTVRKTIALNGVTQCTVVCLYVCAVYFKVIVNVFRILSTGIVISAQI